MMRGPGLRRKGAGPPFFFGVLSILAIVPMLVLAGGFELPRASRLALQSLTLLFCAAFVLEYVFAWRSASPRRGFLKSTAAEAILVTGLLCGMAATAASTEITGLKVLLVPGEVYLVLNLILKFLALFRITSRRPLSYARSFVLSFAGIILAGTLMLHLLPAATVPDHRISLVDAFFTSVSATCVTGLATVDTGTTFTRFGQGVILVLFQVGGLGLMTFAAFFALALGKGMGLREREAMRGVLNLRVSGSIVRVVVGILLLTFLVEGLAAVALYSRWGDAWSSVFHAVSAFCNAGFSLHSDSLSGFVSDPVVNWTVMAEIVIGGLGFGVLVDILGRRYFGISVLGWLRPTDQGPAGRLTVQTRIVLISTVVLIVAGAVLTYLFEAGNPATLGNLSAGDRITAAVFQSVTSRTAGFNTIPIGEMTEESQFLTMLLMLIGASPGSTGGGVKTVTTVVMILAVVSLYRNRTRVEVFGRTLPVNTVNHAVVIVSTAIVFVTLTTLILTIFENRGTGSDPRFLSLFFEAASAFGTVGLSTGITPGLSIVSKLTLCVTMFVGRVGPLFLVLALSQRQIARPYEYPEEHVMIG
ncbi:MAG: potassium transporter TrkG [Planctomycetota bacterium]